MSMNATRGVGFFLPLGKTPAQPDNTEVGISMLMFVLGAVCGSILTLFAFAAISIKKSDGEEQ